MGSARVSRAGNGVLAIANFAGREKCAGTRITLQKDCCSGTPQLTRETRALPNPTLRFREVSIVDFKPDKSFHSAALRRDDRVSDS